MLSSARAQDCFEDDNILNEQGQTQCARRPAIGGNDPTGKIDNVNLPGQGTWQAQ